MSLCSESDFERKLEQLKHLNELWMQKKEGGLQVLDTSLPVLPPSNTISSNEEFKASLTTIEYPDIPDNNAICPEVTTWLTRLISKVVEEEEE